MRCGVRLEARDPSWLGMAAVGGLLLMGPLTISMVIYRHFFTIAVPVGVGLVVGLAVMVTLLRRWVVCSEQEPGYCRNCGLDMRSQPVDDAGRRRCPTCGVEEVL